jgi:hypothetical protein
MSPLKYSVYIRVQGNGSTANKSKIKKCLMKFCVSPVSMVRCKSIFYYCARRVDGSARGRFRSPIHLEQLCQGRAGVFDKCVGRWGSHSLLLSPTCLFTASALSLSLSFREASLRPAALRHWKNFSAPLFIKALWLSKRAFHWDCKKSQSPSLMDFYYWGFYTKINRKASGLNGKI